MRVPVSWLQQYVDFDGTVQELADRLTFAGIEVEGQEQIGGEYEGMVAASVTSVEPHPNADRLKLCRVFDGTSEHLVVCGAPEVRTDARYAFAPVGAVLPDGTQLRKAKLRGVESLGMLLAEDELGLSDDHSGLYELPAGTKSGTPLFDVLGPPETVLDLEITPNRPDCLSLVGVAREVAALSGGRVIRPACDYTEGPNPAGSTVSVHIEDPDDCPRYTARIIRGVRIGPSPQWMQRRLEAAGIRPISTVVDVTNYVLLETGHPLHAFDVDLLRGNRIDVRRARDGERMVTLDDVERRLDTESLVIADSEGPVALAGIMGGAGSEIRPETRDVLIESACFNRALIRRTSRALGLNTESSYRFARGTDVEGLDMASRRAVALVLELAGGEAEAGVVDAYPRAAEPRFVSVRWDRLNRTLGYTVEPEEAETVFRALELEPESSDAHTCRVRVPSFRGDISIEADLIEEIARVKGLDRIPDRSPCARVVVGAREDRFAARRVVRSRLAALGLQEALNYSLVSPALLDLFGASDRPRRITLPNPLSEEQSVLRTSLLPQIVETLGRNRARQLDEAAVFEIGRVFSRETPDGPVHEEERVAVGLMGPVGHDALQKRDPLTGEILFRWIRGLLDGFFSDLRTPVEYRDAEQEAFMPGACRAIVVGGNTEIGYVGLVRRDAAAEWRLADPIAVAEFSWAPAVESAPVRPRVEPPPVYPSSKRDLAFIVDEAMSHGHTASVIREVAPPELERVELFDMYSGKGIADGRKSLAYTLTWRSSRGTLTDEQVHGFEAVITSALREKLGAELRDA